MKKVFYLAFIGLVLLFTSCDDQQTRVTPVTRLYIEGQEIFNDTLEVPLNSYQEIRIISYSPNYISYSNGYFGITYTWRRINEYPTYLTANSQNLVILSNEQSEGTKEVAEFRMLFSDTIYQVGDLYKLRVQFCDYERTLNVVVR